MTLGRLLQISAEAPHGNDALSSSLIANSIPGRGEPIVAVNSFPVTMLLVPIAQVSLMPQPSTMGQPVTCCQCLAVPSEAAMPPAWVMHSCEKSTDLNCGC